MSTLIFPDNLDFSRPFHFSDEQQPQGARIGGNMPEGLSIDLHDHAEYFGTFPLIIGASPLSCSIFINCLFSELLLALNQGPQSDNRIVAVLHEDTARSTSNRYASKLTRHALQISDVMPDIIQNDGGERQIRERHKFGGRPYCIQEPTLAGSEVLLSQGYRQVVQIDFPISRYDGLISGNWPFGDGIFNFFWKYPFAGEEYYWYIQG
jgi:hypothetical protein